MEGMCMLLLHVCDGAVAIFSRNASDNGKLSFIQVLKDGQNGVDGLVGAC